MTQTDERRDEPEVAITLASLRRISSLAPEDRALGSAILVVLGLNGRQLEDLLDRYGSENDHSERIANRHVRILREERELERHRMLEAFDRLSPEVRHSVADFILALRDEAMDRAGSAAAWAWDVVDRHRSERKAEIAGRVEADLKQRRGGQDDVEE